MRTPSLCPHGPPRPINPLDVPHFTITEEKPLSSFLVSDSRIK